MTLRETALKGGAHLVGREVAGLLIRFGGALIVTRLIGPSNFGLYAGALAIVGTLSTAAQIGGEVFLIRREEEPPRSTYDQVFTILIGSTTAAVALGLAGSLVVGAVIDSPEAVAAFQVLLLTLPLTVLWAPAQAKLERGFHFRSLAFLQVGSDAALYTVAATLAVAGAGVWAPVAGTYAASAFLLVGSYALAAYRPRIDLSRERVRELGRFGLEFTPAPLLWSSANLVNPLVVGASLGSASVGYVALATRLADTASFVSRATYRVSLVALSRVQSDPARLRRGFEEMVSLQAIGVGVPLVALAVVARPLLPVAFGARVEAGARGAALRELRLSHARRLQPAHLAPLRAREAPRHESHRARSPRPTRRRRRRPPAPARAIRLRDRRPRVDGRLGHRRPRRPGPGGVPLRHGGAVDRRPHTRALRPPRRAGQASRCSHRWA